MGILPMDVCTHTLAAQRRTHRGAIFYVYWKLGSRWRGGLDRAALDVREYTHPWTRRPCYDQNTAGSRPAATSCRTADGPEESDRW